MPPEFVHCVQVDKAGQAPGFAACKRPQTGAGFAFERLIPATVVVHHAFFDPFDQVPLGATSLSHYRRSRRRIFRPP